MSKEIQDLETNTNIKEDIREGSVEDFDVENKALLVHRDLPGLDIKNGKYRVRGTISASPVFRRKGPNTNIAKSCGYAIEDVETGNVLYVTKREGVTLAARYGMQNGYIIKHTREKKDSITGDVIKRNETIYLQPYPAREESFTQDGRLISVFKLDENNKIKYPLELMIKEEQCSKDFWLLVQQIYEKKKNRTRRNKKRERGLVEKRRKRILEIEAEISKVNIKNPFEDM